MKTGRTFTSMLCNVFLSKHKRLVAVSRHCKADLVQLWRVSSTQSEYISVIHNTISNEGKFLQNQWRRENKRILTLGHAVGYKNPYLWTRVANSVTAIFPDFRFTWVGDGPLFDELVLLTAGNNRVEFVRASTEVWNYFSDTYLYYHPSSMESHGIAVLEAMASSIPCVVSNAGGLPESVVNEYNGFIVSVNEEVEHVNAIVSLINEPDKAAEFSSNSLKRYHENFSSEVWKSMMKQTFEFK